MLSIEEFKAVFDAAPDGVIVVGAAGVIRAVNPKVEQLFGWPAGELEGQTIEVLIPDRVHDRHVSHRTGFMKRPHDRPMGAGLDLRARRRDGTEFPVEVSLSPWVRSEEDVRVVCTVRDISSIRRLQNFSEGALRASEEERQRIARELHDDTAQRLATLILRVRMLAQQNDDAARMEFFEEVREEIVEAADAVKRLSRGLRPPELEELGLELALHAHVRTLREAGVFDVTLDMSEVDPWLDDIAKLAVYRIVQESLSNARRHSGATTAHVQLRRDEHHIVAEVTDGGRGFTFTGGTGEGRGLGLIGMHERATMIGGRISVESRAGEGTTIRVEIPINTGADLG